MGFLDYKVKKTFGKIFKGVSTQLGADISDIKIIIKFKDGESLYGAYNEKEKVDGKHKVTQIKFDDYLGMFDSGTHVIAATIGQAGGRYAQELSKTLNMEVSPNDVSVILRDNPNEIPYAALVAFRKEQREIDVKKEFTQDATS